MIDTVLDMLDEVIRHARMPDNKVVLIVPSYRYLSTGALSMLRRLKVVVLNEYDMRVCHDKLRGLRPNVLFILEEAYSSYVRSYVYNRLCEKRSIHIYR